MRDRYAPAAHHRRLGAPLVAIIWILAACQGGAGEYPGDDPITIVVPFAEGGPTDTVTRLIAEPMAAELGGEVIVSNVEGAGGTTAAGQVADAEPDGYTVLMHHIGMSTAPSLYPDLAYDPLEDFEMIGLVTEVPMTFVGSPEFEPNTMEELVTYVEENIDTVTYANAGVGAASHLCGLLFENATGLDLTEVPYDGTAPAMDDLLGNQVDFMCDQTTSTTDDIQADAVKPYAVTTAERLDTLPDIPTTEEAGLDIQVTVWHGLYVPADTPQEIVDALTAALVAALQDEEVATQLTALGAPPVSEDRATPDAHRQLLEEQIEFWRPVIEEAGVTGG
ncbi:MAG TPA: tripartite tricarboxylate transporter substrate-binding protein [Actinomycetota bacterium]|nr:tripartite tricarboxylate transporter substrate-binding protein [Actinomycetota bacterium]